MRSIVLVTTFIVAALAAPDPFGYPYFGHRPDSYYYGPQVTEQAYRYGNYPAPSATGQSYYGEYPGPSATGQSYYGEYPGSSATNQNNDDGPNDLGSSTNAIIAPSLGGHFTPIPHPPNAPLKFISANRNYLWGSDSKNDVYMCPRPCHGNWQSQFIQLTQLDVDETEVWGVDTNIGRIYKRSVDGSSPWKEVPGPGRVTMKFVSATGDGYIWGVDTNSDIFKCKKPCFLSWLPVNGSMIQVSGSRRYVYGLDVANQVSIRSVDGSGPWKVISTQPPMKDITASGVDYLYGVSTINDLYRCQAPCHGGFQNMGEKYDQCHATTNALFCVNSQGNIYRLDLP